jgi:uncharacterized protein YcaQ
MERLSLAQARRIALAAQGFGAPRPATVDRGHLRRTVERLGLHQIDSVNVLVRAHYLPAFSRLGLYDRALLDRAAWGRKSERRLFEYWAHEASLLPLELHPLMRWRMDLADRGEIGWSGLRPYAGEQRPRAEAILARIRDEGPLASSDFAEGKGGGGWWGWSEVKQALEWLFWAGHLTTATRRTSFERVYDLPERVIPADILALPAPPAADAKRSLIAHAGRALGVASESDLRDYFRLDLASAATAVRELVEEGVLIPVAIEGWRSAYLHRDAARPRRIGGQALIAPFDPLIWERARTERLFGFRYRIEIYTPAARRTHGYYVLPFLLGDRLVARVDLKADRQTGQLLAQSVHLEPDAPAETRALLAEELQLAASWLDLDAVRYRAADLWG